MSYTPWLLTAVLLGLSSGFAPAWANPSVDVDADAPPTSMADLAPHDDPRSSANLDRLANRMTLAINGMGNQSSTGLETLHLPLLDDLLDEEGNLQLPLGLTVYSTMGDTSIGFGSKF